MRVEILVVPNCPNEHPARRSLQAAADLADLADLGAASVTVTVVESMQEAQRRHFVGSPTFLIDGVDPFAVPGARIGLACRLYPTPDGPAGVPCVEQLRDALLASVAPEARDAGASTHPEASDLGAPGHPG